MKAGKLIFMMMGFSMCITGIFAQSSNEFIRKGNKLYEKGKFNDSEISYRKSLEKKKTLKEGSFNLGDALYKQGKYEEAANQFRQIIANEKSDKNLLSKAYHNLGNSLLKTKKPEESIGAYKESLKLNPKDDETRYNLAYAQAQLKQQQKQQQQQDKDNKDNKDNKDKKDQQDKDKKDGKDDKQKQDQKDKSDKSDKKNEDGKQGDQDKNKEQKAGNQPQKISKEDAQRILDALNNQEKDVQKKVSKKDAVSGRGKIEKDW